MGRRYGTFRNPGRAQPQLSKNVFVVMSFMALTLCAAVAAGVAVSNKVCKFVVY